MRRNLTADTYRRFFQQTSSSLWKNCGFLDCFLRDKGDNIDMWMIKITIKANQIDMDVLFISEVDNVQNYVCPQSPAFSIILLVFEFYPHGQT